MLVALVILALMVIVLAVVFAMVQRRDVPDRWGAAMHGIDMVDDTLPAVDVHRPELDDAVVPDAEVFPGDEAQLHWNHSAELVLIELDRAEEAIDDEDLEEVQACLDRARKVAELGTRLPTVVAS